MSAVTSWPEVATATEYHVAQVTGADTNDGSAALPFATITACANIAVAGDVCRVHAGTYRETVSPLHSGTAEQPIRFEAVEGECPTVVGTEPLSAAFTPEAGNIWVADLADPVEQLFSNGELVFEGQWPNRDPGDLFQSPKAIAAVGTGVQTLGNGTRGVLVVDPNIPAGDWTGSRIYIVPGSRWQSDSRLIQAYDPSTHTLTLDTSKPFAEPSITPMMSNQYYLYNSRLTLDSQDEWYWENGSLYYYSSDDPAAHGLQFKKRHYAFDVSQSHVEIVGFHVFGAAVRLGGSWNTVDSLTIEYSSHLRLFDAYYTVGEVNLIAGDDNLWKNSLVDKSGSAGLVIAGSRNRVENSVFSNVVYQATNHAGIDMSDAQQNYSGNVFAYNTVTHSGRSGIFVYGCRDCRVLYNKVSDYALLTNDMGGIYAWSTDGGGSEIAYNDVGNSSAFYSNGIYLDDATKHFVVHHNFIHDIAFFGACIKEENQYFNNAFLNVGAPFLIDKNFQKNAWQNTNLAKVQNNLSDGTLLIRVGLLPANVTDYGYFEADLRLSPEWQHYSIDFASLYQPGWYAPKPFDISAVTQLAFTPLTNGDFEFDIDNIRLEGPTPLLLDDFESAGGANALGGAPWAGGSGDGTASTAMGMTFQSGGPDAASTNFAAIAGTLFQGWNAAENISWGNMTEALAGSDLSTYSGISFDMRGRLKAFRVLAIDDASPNQDHNASCAFTDATVPTCALDQGVVVDGVTNDFAGAAPDIGDHESGTLRATSGASRSSDPAACGKVADITTPLPERVKNPWDTSRIDAGVGPDAGDVITPASDAGATTGGELVPAGGGCACELVASRQRGRPLLVITALLAAGFLRGRQRRKS